MSSEQPSVSTGSGPSLWSSVPFLLLWLGNTVSVLGDFFGTAAQSVLVYTLTGSKLAMGSLWLAFLLPQVLVRLLAGPLIDRCDRRKLMWISDLIRAAIFAVPAILFMAGSLQVWHLFAAAAVNGVAGALFQPALMATIPGIVPAGSLRKANALLEGTGLFMSLVGPALGATTVQMAGPGAALLTDAVSFAASAVTLILMPLHRVEAAESREKRPFVQDLLTGFRYYAQHRELLWLAGLVSIFNMTFMAAYAQFLPFAMEQLGTDLVGLGLIESAFSLGAILGTFFAGFVGEMKQRSAYMMGSLVVSGLTMAWLGLVHQLWAAIFLWLLNGFFMPFFSINSAAIYQRVVPDHLRGRVFSARLVLGQGVEPLGAFMGGVLAQVWGLPLLFVVSGLIPAVAATFGYFQPALRGLDGELKVLNETAG